MLCLVNNMETKICTKCKKEYLATLKYFYKSKKGKNKLYSLCKKCTNKTKKKYRQKYQNGVKGYLRHIYTCIKHRCNNPKDIGYKYYGGRGIKCRFISDEFVDYVIKVLKIDPRGLEIDRINNDGNYEKGNIRFITHQENCNNRRKKLLSEQSDN